MIELISGKLMSISAIALFGILLSGLVFTNPQVIGLDRGSEVTTLSNQGNDSSTQTENGNFGKPFAQAPFGSDEYFVPGDEGVEDSVMNASMSEEEVISLVLSQDFVISWLKDFEDYDSWTYFYYGVWEVDLVGYATDVTGYMFVWVNDSSSEIIDYWTYVEQDVPLDVDKALDLAGSHVVVQEFLATYNDDASYEVFDFGSGYWEVYYYSLVSDAFVDVYLDGINELVLGIYSNFESSFTNLGVEDVENIVLSLPEISEVASNVSLEIFYYWWAFPEEGTEWYVGIYSNEDEMNWNTSAPIDIGTSAYLGYVVIDDESGEVIEQYLFSPARLTEAEVIGIANALPEIQEFTSNITDAEMDVYYDGFSHVWYVTYYSFSIPEAYASVLIDDASGTVLEVTVSYPSVMPTMTIDEAISMVQTTEEYQELVEIDPEVVIYGSFYEGVWYVWVYSEIYWELAGEFLIDDNSGEFLSITVSFPEVMPTMTVEEVLGVVNSSELVQEYFANYTSIYIVVGYYQGLWYVFIYSDDTTSVVYIEIDDATQTIVYIELTEYFIIMEPIA